MKFRAFKDGEFTYSFTKERDRLGWFFSNMKGYPISQYIGIDDSDGNSIYEGDILRNGTMIYVVEKYMGAWVFPYIFLENDGKIIHNVGRAYSNHLENFQKSKVIGNIYKNGFPKV